MNVSKAEYEVKTAMARKSVFPSLRKLSGCIQVFDGIT